MEISLVGVEMRWNTASLRSLRVCLHRGPEWKAVSRRAPQLGGMMTPWRSEVHRVMQACEVSEAYVGALDYLGRLLGVTREAHRQAFVTADV